MPHGRLSFPPNRQILMLQGVASLFLNALGIALRERGHSVLRINFSLGDRWFWRSGNAIDYRGKMADWPAFVAQLLVERSITDIVLFGDCREVHRPAILAAQKLGIAVHVLEEGYLRPDWITLEAGGVNGYSSLPRDPDVYRAQGALLPQTPHPRPVGGGMKQRIRDDIIWNSLTILGRFLYGDYRTHRPFNAFVEYAGWLRRLSKAKGAKRHAQRVVDGCSEAPGRAYVLALQLDSDYQIRVHSPFSGMTEVIEKVIASFAKHAPKDSMLVVKNHPLDNGLINHRKTTRATARKHGVSHRVRFIDGGHLPTLLDSARGLVVVNSTVGLSGLYHHCPTKTLSDPVYNLPGLTYQGALDSFWEEGKPADRPLFEAFNKVIAARTQLNGNFYTAHGIALGVDAAVQRIEATAVGVDVDTRSIAWTDVDMHALQS